MIGTYYVWDISLIITQVISLILILGGGILIYNFIKKINYIIQKLDKISEIIEKKDVE